MDVQTAAAEETSAFIGFGDFITIAFIVTLAFLLMVALFWLVRGLKKVEQGTSESERAFEKELLGTVPIVGVPQAAPPQASPAAMISGPPRAAAPPLVPHRATGNASGPPAGVEDLAQRLSILGAIGPAEGRVALPLPPDGLIHRLPRGKGTCAIIPRQESEAYMVHLCKRFDMIFALTQEGEVLVYQRLQARIPDLVE